MHITKRFLVVCLTTISLGAFCARAADTEKQARAREALRQKMQELGPVVADSETSSINKSAAKVESKPAAKVETKPAATVKTKPPEVKLSPVAQNVPPPANIPPTYSSISTAPADSEKSEKAREALRQKMKELEAASADSKKSSINEPVAKVESKPAVKVETKPAAPVAAKPPEVKAATVVQNAPPPVVAAPTYSTISTAPVDSDKAEKAREALRQKMKELEAASSDSKTTSIKEPVAKIESKPAVKVETKPAASVAAKPPEAKAAPVVQNAPPPVVIAPIYSSISAVPADSDKAEKAREALRQKMKELESAPADSKTTSIKEPVVKVESKPAVKVETKPVAPVAAKPPEVKAATVVQNAPPPVVTAPIYSSVGTAPTDSEKTEKAREALREKMKDLDAKEAVTVSEPPTTPPPTSFSSRRATNSPVVVRTTPPKTSEPVVKTTPAPEKKPVTTVSKPTTIASSAPIYSTLPTTTDSGASAKAREELRKKMAELEAQQKAASSNQTKTVATPEPRTTQAETKPVAKKAEVKKETKPDAKTSETFTPLPAPPSSIPASKELRLQGLNEQYRTDRITPQEYHDQRAKILSEP